PHEGRQDELHRTEDHRQRPDSTRLMIKLWLNLSLQSTYQGARYAGARTRYGLPATRALPDAGDGHETGNHPTRGKLVKAVTMPSPAEAVGASGHRRRTATRHANGRAKLTHRQPSSSIDVNIGI